MSAAAILRDTKSVSSRSSRASSLRSWIGAALGRLWFCSLGLEITHTCSMSLPASSTIDGCRKALASICNMSPTDPSGRIIGAITPPEISRTIYECLQPAEYDRIQAPALGIFNVITPQYRLPYYWYLDPARQEEFNRNIESLAKWIEGAIQRFRSGVKNSRVIELHDTNHYVFIVDEALVVRETRKFLLQE